MHTARALASPGTAGGPVPAECRWHVSSGVAHPSGDGSDWCRLPHAVVCPARDTPPPPPELAALRRSLAVNSRRLIDARAFAPPPARDGTAPHGTVCRPARPVVQLLYVRYLASLPVDEIQCVAQARRRHRCTSPLLTSDAPAWTWRPAPATASSWSAGPASRSHGALRPQQPAVHGAVGSGAPSAVSSTPPCPRPPTWRWPSGSPSIRCAITSTSAPVCPPPPDVPGLQVLRTKEGSAVRRPPVHHAVEVALTRPATPGELRSARRHVPLAVNADRTRLMVVHSARSPGLALHLVRRLSARLPID
ncbi:hypothetical protein SCHAM137S_01913 [Streptomyces chartreusis]